MNRADTLLFLMAMSFKILELTAPHFSNLIFTHRLEEESRLFGFSTPKCFCNFKQTSDWAEVSWINLNEKNILSAPV